MNPAIFFPLAGVVLIVWGSVCAVFNNWAARFMKQVQSIYGKKAADMVTPRFVRVIGLLLVAGGVLFVVLGFAGVFPNHG